MSIYIINGFNPEKVEILYENVDLLTISKIYCISNYSIEETEVVKSVNDKNLLKLYNSLELEKSEDKVIFISCDTKDETYLDIMYSLNTAKFNNRSYYVCKDKTIQLKDFPLIEHFNPWTGDTLSKFLTEKEKNQIVQIFRNIVEIIVQYLKAEFHLKKITSIPDGWAMNLAAVELQHIILYYGLKPHAPDVAKNIEFVHNSQYREIVCKTLIHVAANFLIRNGYLTYGKKYDWFNLNTWNSIEF